MDLPLLCGTIGLLTAAMPGAPCARVTTPCQRNEPSFGHLDIVARDGEFAIAVADNVVTAPAPVTVPIGAHVRMDGTLHEPLLFKGPSR